MTETIHKVIKEDKDSIEVGSATKGGKLKVYGSFKNPKEFKERIDNAKEVLAYATEDIPVNGNLTVSTYGCNSSFINF